VLRPDGLLSLAEGARWAKFEQKINMRFTAPN
jgi:hypothetical protein